MTRSKDFCIHWESKNRFFKRGLGLFGEPAELNIVNWKNEKNFDFFLLIL